MGSVARPNAMEPDADRFERRALSAAGPVFLVAIGLVLLLVLGVILLLQPLDALTAWLLGLVGTAALVGGLFWGAAQNRRSSRRTT